LTVKKYLEQFEGWEKELLMNIDQLNKLNAKWKAQTTAPTNPQDAHELEAAFEVLGKLYKSEIKRLLQQMYDLQRIIYSLDDSLLRVVLTEKYINLKTPENIAAEIPCDVRTVYRWLKDAVDTIHVQHPNLFETDEC
jgi:hypothetical protein